MLVALVIKLLACTLQQKLIGENLPSPNPRPSPYPHPSRTPKL
jgi:hypothetical protein